MSCSLPACVVEEKGPAGFDRGLPVYIVKTSLSLQDEALEGAFARSRPLRARILDLDFVRLSGKGAISPHWEVQISVRFCSLPVHPAIPD